MNCGRAIVIHKNTHICMLYSLVTAPRDVETYWLRGVKVSLKVVASVALAGGQYR